MDALIGIWLLCGIAGAVLAEKRGRSAATWAGICILTGLVGLLVLVVMPAPTPDTAFPSPSAIFGEANDQPSTTMVDDLERLAALRSEGVLTQDEFATARDRVLGA